MTADSIPIPAGRLAPVAEEQARRSKVFGGMAMFVAMCTVGLLWGAADMWRRRPGQAYGSGPEHASLIIAAMVAILVAFTAIAIYELLRAHRANAAATAATDSYTFALAGNRVIATNASGARYAGCSFKVSSRLRETLLELPRATVVDRDP